MTMQEAIAHLLEMFKTGEWDFICAIRCALIIVSELLAKMTDHDNPDVIGAKDTTSLIELGEAMGVAKPAGEAPAGPVSNLFMQMLIKKLMELALKWFQEIE